VPPPRIAREPSIAVGLRDFGKILLGAERCTVPFWREQQVGAYPECRGR
jgi:hypothetical protein